MHYITNLLHFLCSAGSPVTVFPFLSPNMCSDMLELVVCFLFISGEMKLLNYGNDIGGIDGSLHRAPARNPITLLATNRLYLFVYTRFLQCSVVSNLYKLMPKPQNKQTYTYIYNQELTYK